MKKFISVFLCVFLLSGAFSLSAFGAKDEEKTEETTEIVLELDVNKRYTDIAEVTDSYITENEEENNSVKTVYIAVLCAALVVSVVILAVSLKRVPKEEDIDISGQNKIKKDRE